jgi:hypothetical protein
MSTLTSTPRTTGGFSLDDAARAVRNSLSDLPALCPTCDAPLCRIQGREHGECVWIFRCDACGRGLVFLRSDPGHRHTRLA